MPIFQYFYDFFFDLVCFYLSVHTFSPLLPEICRHMYTEKRRGLQPVRFQLFIIMSLLYNNIKREMRQYQLTCRDTLESKIRMYYDLKRFNRYVQAMRNRLKRFDNTYTEGVKIIIYKTERDRRFERINLGKKQGTHNGSFRYIF